MIKRILVGSRAFFRDIPGFSSKDSDYVEFIEKSKLVKHFCQVQDMNGFDVFQVVKEPIEDMIAWNVEHLNPMAAGKFLVPEFSREVGFLPEMLEKIKPMIDKLDEKHGYEKIIYEAYLENGEFILTPEQKEKAYNEYRRVRDEK